ncbi:MAG: hypothetical protein CFE21_02235 [Bacteroidetes bacterium B1(2017)]|nr:MAG: hypothetical protein CFE21_02235 [Bacteroidetes bacterium B1(2017)]
MMKRLFTKLALLTVCWLSVTSVYAQSITLDVQPRVVCLGNPMQIDVYLSGASVNDVTSYRFDWGNGDSSINNVGKPVSNTRTYQYGAAGVYNITVTARFSNRAPIVTSYWDTVYNRPIANFSLVSLDSQCFKYNQYCFKDLTAPGPYPSLPLRLEILSYGDGDSNLIAPGSTTCHFFGQGNRRFNVGLTTTDVGGCETKAFKYVFVAPNINPRFTVSGIPKCDTTPYIFVNNTPVSTSDLMWFRWEYGDDSVWTSSNPIKPQEVNSSLAVTDSTNRWQAFTYKYTKNGVFNPRLIVRHKRFNCADTFDFSTSGNQLPENIVLRYDIRSRRNNSNDTIADSVCLMNRNLAGLCLYNNYPLQGVNSQIQLLWDFADPNANPPGSDKKLNEVTPCYRYQGMGHYFPVLYVACPGQPVKTINFWSRIDTAQLSDTQYAPPPIVNPNINTINGYFFKATDSIAQFRWIMGANGIPRDSIVSYWKWFNNDPTKATFKKRESQLQGYGVNVLGPLAQVEDPPKNVKMNPALKNQCGPTFPVEFTNATNAYQSNNLYIRWDFADNFAPRCTSFSTPNPAASRAGLEPYTTANDMFNRTLGRFITGGVVYPGRVNCAFSHDTLPIHQYQKWSDIYRWYYYGHDFPPYDSTNWTNDPTKPLGGAGNPRFLVHKLDSAPWGLPMYSAGVTPSRIDTLGKMWPADINPNRPIILNGMIPDPFASSMGQTALTIPPGTRVDTSGFLVPRLSGFLPNGQNRANYRGNMKLPGSSMTLYEYFFKRSVEACYTVKLYERDSFNNQSDDPMKSLTRINMVGGKIVIQQRTDTTVGHAVIHVSDTFSTTSTPKGIDSLVSSVKIINAGTGYAASTYVPTTGGSGVGLRVGITVNGAGAVTSAVVLHTGIGYKSGDIVTITTGGGNATLLIDKVYLGLVYDFKPYPILSDGSGKYIMVKDDEFVVDFFDCGGEATVQLPLASADAYGVGQKGRICPGLYDGEKGGNPQIVFDNSASPVQNAGTYPDCGQRTVILINYDSFADRHDNTPCQLDGWVDWQGMSASSGFTSATTGGGNVWPNFWTNINFGPPPAAWTSASGAINFTHYQPAKDIPWPFTHSPQDRNGYVTIGIQVGNGVGSYQCLSQTVWYHNFFHFITLATEFTYRKVGGYPVYGNPSRLPSQDFTYDTAKFYIQINPAAPPPQLYTANGAYREPWSRLFGKGDILEFEPYAKQQDFVLTDEWVWGDGIVTVDSFYTNKYDTFVKLDPIGHPNDSSYFVANTYPVNRIRYEFETSTFPWTILSTTIPYPVGVKTFNTVRYDTIWQCNDLTHALPPQSITPVNIFIDTAFFIRPVQHQYFMSSYEMPAGPGSNLKKNEITMVQHRMKTTTECLSANERQIVIGVMDTFYMKEGNDMSDGILCVGQTVNFVDSIRYWFPKSGGAYNPSRPLNIPAGEEPLLRFLDMHGAGMANWPIDSIKTYPNVTKVVSTIATSCPTGWYFVSQGTAPNNYNFCIKIDTNFYERIYWDFESDGVIDYAGKNPSHKFDQPGRFKVSMISRDTVGYFDTCSMFLDVVKPVAHFNSQKIFACSDPTIFHDSSYIMDGCYATTGFSCDQIKERRWWFGDYGYGKDDYRSILTDPFYPYRKNGWYRVQEVIETNQGCFDTTFKDIYISGPRPRIKLLSDTLGCVPYTIRVVSYPNDSGNIAATRSTLIRSGRSDGGYNAISTQNPDTITITYDAEGVYYLTAVGYDQNPPVLSTCPPIVLPDTVNGFEKPIKIYVKNPYFVGMETSKDKVCVGEVFEVKNTSDMDTITKFRMYAYNEDFTAIADTAFKTNFDKDSTFKYLFYQPGVYNLVMHSTRFIPNTPPCESRDTVQVTALKAKADLKIDSIGLPKYNVWNMSDSSKASSYYWRVYNADGTTERTSVFVPSNDDPNYHLGVIDFKNDTGNFWVCVWAMTAGVDNCYDSACKMITNTFTIDIDIPNVFTPNKDGVNDVFHIKIKGEELYDLKIWNRWGGQVFETTDPTKMWNGTTNNTGAENPEGTYYFVFRYKLRTQAEQTVRGTITLIRD